MDAAKDLLKRAVELDSAQRYSEAIICYEEGIQNILRAIGGILNQLRTVFMNPYGYLGLPVYTHEGIKCVGYIGAGHHVITVQIAELFRVYLYMYTCSCQNLA